MADRSQYSVDMCINISSNLTLATSLPQEPSPGVPLLLPHPLDPPSHPPQTSARTSARDTSTPSPSSEGKSLYLRYGRPLLFSDTKSSSFHTRSAAFLILLSVCVCRTSGFGVCVTTRCWPVTRWPSATSGRACPRTSTPPTRGTMGNLSSSRVGPIWAGLRRDLQWFQLLKRFISWFLILCRFVPPGDRYWVFSESSMDKDSPKSLKDLGTSLPKDKIDAALFYTPTGQTYFFRGNKWVSPFCV